MLNNGTEEPQQLSFWETLALGAEAPPELVVPRRDGSEGRPLSTVRWRLWVRLGDIGGTFFWAALFVHVVVGWDRLSDQYSVPLVAWLIDYRGLVLLGLLTIVGLFLWRGLTLFVGLYVLLFPFVVMFWKLPAFIVRRRSWLLAMALLNFVALGVRNLRYNLISKPLTALAMLAIIVTDLEFLAILAGLTLVGTFGWSFGRTIVDTFHPNWFLSLQRKAIERIINSEAIEKATYRSEALTSVQPSRTSVVTAANSLSFAIVVNRATYVWAYRLSQYRHSQLAFLFNSATYIGLFFRALLTSMFVNLAIYRIDSNQFTPNHDVPLRDFALHGLASLFPGGGADLSALGTMAEWWELAMGLFGVVFLAAFVANLMFTYSQAREDAELRDTINSLRTQARRHDEQFTEAIGVTIQEAIQRLQELELGLIAIFAYFAKAVPEDFYRDPQGQHEA